MGCPNEGEITPRERQDAYEIPGAHCGVVSAVTRTALTENRPTLMSHERPCDSRYSLKRVRRKLDQNCPDVSFAGCLSRPCLQRAGAIPRDPNKSGGSPMGTRHRWKWCGA